MVGWVEECGHQLDGCGSGDGPAPVCRGEGVDDPDGAVVTFATGQSAQVFEHGVSGRRARDDHGASVGFDRSQMASAIRCASGS